MTNRELANLIRRHKGNVLVDACAANDTIPVRVYKNDILDFLRQGPEAEAPFYASVNGNDLYLHPAH